MCNKGERVMQAKEKLVVYEICEECHGNGFIRPNRFSDKDIDTTYVCNACGGSGHSGKHYE
tara:strand:+ start:13034 stop:13216 length:183 start_codon:yes stop_codon:yes gene_type:complete